MTEPARPQSIAPARDLVFRELARDVRRFPQLDLDDPAFAPGIDQRDTALARAIIHSTRRHWLTMQALLEHRLNRPWDRVQPNLRAVLLGSAAQLFYFDRLPDHAVLDDAVEWVRSTGFGKATGFINAVLRGLLRLRGELVEETAPRAGDPMHADLLLDPVDVLPRSDGRAWRFTEPAFDPAPNVRLAQQTSHPLPLVERWINAIGLTDTCRRCHHNLIHAPIILQGVSGDHPELQPHQHAGAAVFSGSHEALLALLEAQPDARVQDPTSAAACELTRDMNPSVIVDLCAGRGTKTHQLAALHPEARIITTDVDDHRRASLHERFREHPRVEVVEPNQWRALDGQADLVILDVPCSNTGVLARRVEARYRADKQSFEGLIRLQRQISGDGVLLLKDNGLLLYTTCSVEPAENERQAEWIARQHKFDRVASQRVEPCGLPGEPSSIYCDGGFAALLRRR